MSRNALPAGNAATQYQPQISGREKRQQTREEIEGPGVQPIHETCLAVRRMKAESDVASDRRYRDEKRDNLGTPRLRVIALKTGYEISVLSCRIPHTFSRLDVLND